MCIINDIVYMYISRSLVRSSKACWVSSSPAGTHRGSRCRQHPGCCASRWAFVWQHPAWAPSPCQRSGWCNAAACTWRFYRRGSGQILEGNTEIRLSLPERPVQNAKILWDRRQLSPLSSEALLRTRASSMS